MTRRSKVWLTIASVFTVINIAGVGFAAAATEQIHAAVHVGLTLVGAYWVWRVARSAREPRLSGAPLANERLEQLQQSVDAVAIEVERIGESQRYAAKVAAERAEAFPPKRP